MRFPSQNKKGSGKKKKRSWSKKVGYMVRVLSLQSGDSRFEPRPWQLVKVIRGINGPCKIVYDRWYKNGQKSVSFSGHISNRLSVVLVRAKPHKGYATEKLWSSTAKCQSLAPRALIIGHLCNRLRRKAPRRYLTFSSLLSCGRSISEVEIRDH